MKEPEENDGHKVPGDNTNESGHSEGFYEIRPEHAHEPAPEQQPEHKNRIADDTDRIKDDTDKFRNDKNKITDDTSLKKTVRRKTIIGLIVLLGMLTLFVFGFAWVMHQPKDEEAYGPLRKILDLNEKVNRQFYKESSLAPLYPISKSEKKPRVNGDLGMDTSFKIADWELYVVNIDSHDTMTLNMDSIKKLPKTEICFNFKCIEGWSQITFWGGVRFIDFVNHYHLATHSHKPLSNENASDVARYAGFQTPDDQYYVGLDMASALHPQTLLCYEMNGKPLAYDQGAPLRLIVPVKYGIKSLKRIGVIFFSDRRPADYWYEQGYDYDAAL